MSEGIARHELRSERLTGACQPLEQATTLPAEAFNSPEVYETEVERIFQREWLCAGRADQIPEVGDYFTLDLLGEKLVVVRDKGDEIRALSRICRHRAAEVVSGEGNARSFRCPYHAWTYRLDGRLAAAPYMDRSVEFYEASRLPEIRCEQWEGWIFVNFDPDATPLATGLAPLSKLLVNYGMSDMMALPTATFDSPFNWKVLVDNFMEAYHHIAIHRETFEPQYPARFSKIPDNEGPYSILVMPKATWESEDGEDLLARLPRAGGLDDEEESQLLAVSVYPFHLFALTAESLSWYQLLPHTHERFTLRIYSCFPRETLEGSKYKQAVEAVQAFTKLVHQQDIHACQTAWAGLNTRSFEGGRLSHLEKAIWQFNQWWINRMTEREGEL